MKQHLLKIVILSTVVMISTTTFGQLTVNSDGQTKVVKQLAVGADTDFEDNTSVSIKRTNTGNTNPFYGLYTRIVPTTGTAGDCYGLYSYISPSSTQMSSVNLIGVYGHVAKTPSIASKFGAGIVGLGSSNNGIGIYGGIGTSIPTSWVLGTYAGYFNGDVKVTGNVKATSFVTTSDMRLKENIQTISLDYASKILELTPVSYNFKKDTIHFYIDENSKDAERVHYGLLAQEIQAVYPNLVTENADGYLAVNYQELIPMLIESMKGLNNRIQELEAIVADARKSQIEPSRVAAKNDIDNTIATLYQNTPNPFSVSTTIAYELPNDTKEAAIYIYDMNGTQIQKYELTTIGKSSIEISPKSLQAGMYLYSLIADGQTIDTKRMILTK